MDHVFKFEIAYRSEVDTSFKIVKIIFGTRSELNMYSYNNYSASNNAFGCTIDPYIFHLIAYVTFSFNFVRQGRMKAGVYT